MKSITALWQVFIGIFALSLPGTSVVSQFSNVIFAAWAAAAAVAFVYDNLPTNPHEQLSFIKVKLAATVAFIAGSPILLYAYIWRILAPVGFAETLLLLVLYTIVYIPFVIVIWIIVVAIFELLG